MNSEKSSVKLMTAKGSQFPIQIIQKKFVEHLFSGIHRSYVTKSPSLKDVARSFHGTKGEVAETCIGLSTFEEIFEKGHDKNCFFFFLIYDIKCP